MSTLLTSCSLLDWNSKPAVNVREHPMLAAARAGEITLFGDLHDRDAEEYYSRSAISLKRHTYAEIGGDNDADLTSDGTRLVFSSTRHNIKSDLYHKTVDGTAVTQLTGDPSSGRSENMMDPPRIRAVRGRIPMMAWEMTDLPDPDSPTRATVRP